MGRNLRESNAYPIISIGFNNHYKIKDIENLRALVSYVTTSTFWNNSNLLFTNPSDYVASLRLYPFNTAEYFNEWGADYPVAIKFGNQTSSIYGAPLYPHTTKYELASFSVNRKYNNFLDFAPYTKLELYIPFFGFINLDVNMVMGKDLKIYLSIDFDSGSGQIFICVNENEQETLIQTINGQVGFDIPLGASNVNENAKTMMANALTFAGGTITSIVTQNPLAMMMTGLTAVKGGLDALQERISKGGASSGKSAFVNPSSLYLIRTTPNPTTEQTAYAHTKGIPLQEERRLIDLKGFTIIRDVHCSGFTGATKNEIDEIETLLKNGVIF